MPCKSVLGGCLSNFSGGVSNFSGGEVKVKAGPPNFLGGNFFLFLLSMGIHRLPPPDQTPEYGQRSAGTHPTGMHSCLFR